MLVVFTTLLFFIFLNNYLSLSAAVNAVSRVGRTEMELRKQLTDFCSKANTRNEFLLETFVTYGKAIPEDHRHKALSVMGLRYLQVERIAGE